MRAGQWSEPALKIRVMHRRYKSFSEFYPFYLSQHATAGCRRMHVIGLLMTLGLLFFILITSGWWLLLVLPVVGYGMAWVGHAVFEKNRPATFDHPLYSLAADWVMLRDVLLGRIAW